MAGKCPVRSEYSSSQDLEDVHFTDTVREHEAFNSQLVAVVDSAVAETIIDEGELVVSFDSSNFPHVLNQSNRSDVMPWASFQHRLKAARHRIRGTNETSVCKQSVGHTTRHDNGTDNEQIDVLPVSRPCDRRPKPMCALGAISVPLAKSENIEREASSLCLRTLPAVYSSYEDVLLTGERPFRGPGMERQLSVGSGSTGVDEDAKSICTIMDELSQNMCREAGQLRSLQALHEFCSDANKRDLAGSSGGVEAVLKSMRAFPYSETIQTAAYSVLLNLCVTNLSNKERIGRAGGTQVIIADIQRPDHVDNSDLLEIASSTLAACCHDCKDNQESARREGGIEATLHVMRKGARRTSLQVKCLRALLALVTSNLDNAIHAEEVGGGQDTLAVLRQFPSELAIQIAALSVVFALLIQTSHSRSRFGKDGIIDDLATGLQTFAISRQYTLICTRCLRYLAFDGANRKRIANVDIITVLSTRLKDWRDDFDLSASTLLALGNFTYDNDRAKLLAARHGGISSLVSLLELRTTPSFISEQACRVLRNISDGPVVAKRQCARDGAIRAIAAAMKGLPLCAGMQEHGAAALINLRLTLESQRRSIQLKAHVDTALRIHAATPHTVAQLRYLCGLLGHAGPGLSVASSTFTAGVQTVGRSERIVEQEDRGEGKGHRKPRRTLETGLAVKYVFEGPAMDSAVAELDRSDVAVEY